MPKQLNNVYNQKVETGKYFIINCILGNCDSVPNLSISQKHLTARLGLRRASVSLDGASPCNSPNYNGPFTRYKNRHDVRSTMNSQGSLQVN